MEPPPSAKKGVPLPNHLHRASSSMLHSLLIVEDDESHIELIQRAFEAQPDCVNLTFARTLKVAKEMSLANPPDLIIADWLLPDGKGVELITHISRTRPIPVLMMTSHGNEHLAVEMMKAGAIDYIVKSDVTLISMPHIVRNAWIEWNAENTRKRMAAALDEKEQKYHEIFNNINDAIEIHELSESGLPGKYIEVNDVTCRMLGHTAEELKYMSPLDISTEWHSLPVPEIMQELIKNGHSTFETGQIRKDGTIIPVEINAHLVILQGKQVILSVVRDITPRKKAEDELKESIKKYQTLINSANEGIIVLQDGKIPFANPRALEIIGYPAKILAEKKFTEFVHPDDRDQIFERHMKRIRGENFKSDAKLRIIDKNGTIHWLEVNAVLIEWNEKPATLNFITDISKRKKAEEALRESEEKYRNVIEHIQDVFYRTDNSGVIIMASPSIARVFGYDLPDDYLNKPITILYRNPEERNEFLHGLEKQGFVESYPVELKKKDGTPLIISASSHYYYDNSGNILGVEGTLRDITLQKEAEAALRDSLEEKEILLKEIHHRVKNNLQIVSGLMYLQSKITKDTGTKDILSACRNRIISMALLHENLFKISNFSSVSMGPYINNLVRYLADSYDTAKNLTFEVDIPGDINFDIDTGIAIGMIVTELATNSIKYAFTPGESGRIDITLHPSGERMLLSIRDNGKGLPKGYDLTSSPGLGMKLVTNLVRQVHGTMDVQSVEGTAIIITFTSGIITGKRPIPANH
jgi:PAS domain S-box-containing protein